MVQYASDKIREFWNEAISYSKEYYDRLNEIRIVTGASEADASALGDKYRQMAKDMSVTSTEIAKAAVEFWRQGLNEDEVNARLTSTIQYAKISALEFDDAAELMTAATNGMDVSANKVADVWAYLGDASATGADEIGQAMQKVAATAGEAGLSFEWLGAYIATISEKTRQAPEVIGTSLNSIMSRLQSIKQMGYNEEDETKINDIAKALKNIDVVLMDQSGNWRDMSDIFMDIALQWGDLDDKTRSYIATTVAGTRQKNYFLTLMEDLSKVNSATGEASRAMELYEGALNAAGTAAEKYATYEQSVTAANDRMKASFEQLYSFINANWIKGFYDNMSEVADGIYYMISGNAPDYGYDGIVNDLSAEIESITKLRDEYKKLLETEDRTEAQSMRMKAIIETLADSYRPFNAFLSAANGHFLDGEEALSAMNSELENSVALLERYQKMDFEDKIADISGLTGAKQSYDSTVNTINMGKFMEQVAKNVHGWNASEMTVSQWEGLANTINAGFNNKYYGKKYFEGTSALDGKGNVSKSFAESWKNFFNQWEGSILQGWNNSRIRTIDASLERMTDEVKQKASDILNRNFLDDNGFKDLPENVKTMANGIIDGVANAITGADWNQGAEFVSSKVLSLTEAAFTAYMSIMPQLEDYFANAEKADLNNPDVA